MRAIKLSVVSMLLSVAVLSFSPCASAQDEVIRVKTTNGVSYISGGVGTDERDAMRQRAGDYNLQLAFAARSGAYLAGVKVDIRNAAGRSVLNAEADGPWLFVRLEPGSYRISAEVKGEVMSRAVKVPKQGHATATMLWPD